MLTRVGIAVSAVIVLLAVSIGVSRVSWLAGQEVRDVEASTLREAGADGRLGGAALQVGQTATFEVCAEDRMEPERWRDRLHLQVAVDGEVGLDEALDEELLGTARRNDTDACLRLGRVGSVQAAGQYTIRASYEELPEDLADVPLYAYIIARHEVDDLDLAIVVCAWLGSVLFVVFLALRARVGEVPVRKLDAWEEAQRELSGPLGTLDAASTGRPASESESRMTRLPGVVRVLVGLVAMIGLFFGVGFVTSGAASQLAAGVVLATLEALLGVVLIGGISLAVRIDALALGRPKWWFAWFPGAAAGGLVLMLVAQATTQLVPSTSTSAVEAFVSWPSGMLSFAALAVVAPLAEEVFFRGFVYGALAKRHWTLGFLGAWLTFTAFHATQTWGQWGALAAIAVTGLGLTSIRAVSGSVLVAATAHLVYNGLIAIRAFL